MARPKLNIDEKLLENMALIHCTYDEMALILRCSKDTLKRRFAHIIEPARARGKMSLRRAQYKAAIENLDTGMMRWLGINDLGQHGAKSPEVVNNNLIMANQGEKTVNEGIEEIRKLLLESPNDRHTLEILSREPEKDSSGD